MTWQNYVPEDIQNLYEIHDFKHAAAILANEFEEEFAEICTALRGFKLDPEDITTAGGNESRIPKKFSELLRPTGWVETKLRSRHIVDDIEITHDTHKVDYLKGRVAFDLEWNSKDQTFDRDLYAFRSFFDYDKISLGILVTRSNQLDQVIAGLGKYIDSYGTERSYKQKYGASTTHMGKLLPRLKSGRNGGCPILVFGITPRLINPVVAPALRTAL
ncbi:MAG: BglII/BstYI family type II restriction endonuclease [Gammaproteobacteria bacterium]|nr:BglII/BstYI family type II restriction endonuclease [Gammaproteobacteria bacterium]